MFNEEAKAIINRAKELAREKGTMVTLDHLTYALVEKNETLRSMIAESGTDVDDVLLRITDYFEGEPSISASFSESVEELLHNVQAEAMASGKMIVTPMHLLNALLHTEDIASIYYLDEVIDLNDALVRLSHPGVDTKSSENISSNMGDPFAGLLGGIILRGVAGGKPMMTQRMGRPMGNGECPDEEEGMQFLTDINKIVAEQKEPFIGRDYEIDRTCQILCRKYKNNPIHIGEPGVGKTAIVRGLAKRIIDGNVPEKLKDHTIYELDLAGLVAGTEYRGQMEQRLKDVLNYLEQHEKTILYIDEIHMLVGAGEGSKGSMDAANILKPYLTKGTIRVIGATTSDEYAKHMESDKAFIRRFRTVQVDEPSRDDAVEIVKGLKDYYEKFHGVKYTNEAIEAAVDLSIRHIHDRYLPDKAIDLIDEAGAFINNNNKDGKLTKKQKTVTPELVGEIIAKSCKIPQETVKKDELSALLNLEKHIKNKVFGQDEAVEKVSLAVKMARAGLTDETKPVASFLFVGPTGVGKTELAKVLAKELNEELIRFDMSEYQEAHSVSKLIGAPSGYVGYDDEPLLTKAVKANPNCVLLFDEIEKAHQKVYDIMLQIMDYGMLTDNKGRKISFRNAVIIFTSNAGARDAERSAVGFGVTAAPTKSDVMMDAVSATFAPEFRGRLSSVVSFNYLNKEMAKRIVEKELAILNARLLKRHIVAEYTPEVYDAILEEGFSPKLGAREIAKTIDRRINPIFMTEILSAGSKSNKIRKFKVNYSKAKGYTLSKITAPKKAAPIPLQMMPLEDMVEKVEK